MGHHCWTSPDQDKEHISEKDRPQKKHWGQSDDFKQHPLPRRAKASLLGKIEENCLLTTNRIRWNQFKTKIYHITSLLRVQGGEFFARTLCIAQGLLVP